MLSPDRLRIPNAINKGGASFNQWCSATSVGDAENNERFNYKSLPSSIHHGLSERILNILPEKLAKLHPFGTHHGGGGGGNGHGNSLDNDDGNADNEMEIQRSRTGSLGTTLPPPTDKNGSRSPLQPTKQPKKHVILPDAQHNTIDLGDLKNKNDLSPASPKHSIGSPNNQPSTSMNGKGNS